MKGKGFIFCLVCCHFVIFFRIAESSLMILACSGVMLCYNCHVMASESSLRRLACGKLLSFVLLCLFDLTADSPLRRSQVVVHNKCVPLSPKFSSGGW